MKSLRQYAVVVMASIIDAISMAEVGILLSMVPQKRKPEEISQSATKIMKLRESTETNTIHGDNMGDTDSEIVGSSNEYQGESDNLQKKSRRSRRFPSWVLSIMQQAINQVPQSSKVFHKDVLKLLVDEGKTKVLEDINLNPDRAILKFVEDLVHRVDEAPGSSSDSRPPASGPAAMSFQCTMEKFREKVKKLRVPLKGRKRFAYTQIHVDHLLRLYDEYNFSKSGKRNENNALICEKFLEKFPDAQITLKAVTEKLKKLTKHLERAIRPKIDCQG